MLDILVTNGADDGYYFGMAQTGATDGWYGEDGWGDIVHEHYDALTMTSVHPDCGGAGIDAIVASTTTLFTGSLDSTITYAWYAGDGVTLVDCQGNDCSYYAD